MNPTRIQRKRTAGWRMPATATYVGRPTMWGNPFSFTKQMQLVGPLGYTDGFYDPNLDAETQRMLLTENFESWLKKQRDERAINIQRSIHDLRGRDLACWCPIDGACHADVLLELAA